MLPKALECLKQLDTICKQYPYPYYFSISSYMYASYHIESKEYDKALKEYDELLAITKKVRFIQARSVIAGTRQSFSTYG